MELPDLDVFDLLYFLYSREAELPLDRTDIELWVLFWTTLARDTIFDN